jgi:hypothetical protein
MSDLKTDVYSFDRMIDSRVRISAPITLKPFDLPDNTFLQERSEFNTFQLTEFQGARIHCDIQARGWSASPDYYLRLRIHSIEQHVMATALEDLSVREESPSNVHELTIAQIKDRLRERGEELAMKGVTRKDALQNLLRASDECRRPAQPATVVVQAGQTGRVVKERSVNSQGEQRIGVSFRQGHVLMVAPQQVKLSEPKFTDGEEIIGEGSTYQVTGGSITFEKFFGDDKDEFFVNSPSPVPATPGSILVPWRKAFSLMGKDEPQSLLKRNEQTSCRVLSKLELTFRGVSRLPLAAAGDGDLETPEPKRKRARAE